MTTTLFELCVDADLDEKHARQVLEDLKEVFTKHGLELEQAGFDYL